MTYKQKYDEESARALYNLLDRTLSDSKNKIPNAGNIRVEMCRLVIEEDSPPVSDGPRPLQRPVARSPLPSPDAGCGRKVMKYLILALALTACASAPPREAPRKVDHTPVEAAVFGFTIGLLVFGMAWNFMPEGK